MAPEPNSGWLPDGTPQDVLVFHSSKRRIPTFSHDVQTCANMCKLYVYVYWLSPCFKSTIVCSTVKSNRCEMPKFGPHPHCCRSETSHFGREIQGLVVKFTWRVNSFSSSRAHFCSNSRSELSKMAFSENCLFHGIPFHHIPSTFMNQILLVINPY